MARTILYTERSGQPPPPITFGGPSPRTREKATKPDDYTGKLVKYVPAEVLAFFAPMAAAVEGRRDLLIAAMVAALLATPETSCPHVSFISNCLSGVGIGYEQPGLTFWT